MSELLLTAIYGAKANRFLVSLKKKNTWVPEIVDRIIFIIHLENQICYRSHK